jgi:hypothetical protein
MDDDKAMGRQLLARLYGDSLRDYMPGRVQIGSGKVEEGVRREAVDPASSKAPAESEIWAGGGAATVLTSEINPHRSTD